MEFIKDWAFSVCIAYLIVGFVMVIAPENVSKNSIRLIVSVFILLVVISPFFNNINIMQMNKISIKKMDFDAFQTVAKKAGEEISVKVADEILKEKGVSIKVTNVKLYNDEKEIKCSIVTIEMDKHDKGLKNDIKQSVANKLSIDSKSVLVNEG